MRIKAQVNRSIVLFGVAFLLLFVSACTQAQTQVAPDIPSEAPARDVPEEITKTYVPVTNTFSGVVDFIELPNVYIISGDEASMFDLVIFNVNTADSNAVTLLVGTTGQLMTTEDIHVGDDVSFEYTELGDQRNITKLIIQQ